MAELYWRGAPGLCQGGSETATASRERRRVNMAAREVGSMVKDELAQLRSQVSDLRAMLEQVIAMTSTLSSPIRADVPDGFLRSKSISRCCEDRREPADMSTDIGDVSTIQLTVESSCEALPNAPFRGSASGCEHFDVATECASDTTRERVLEASSRVLPDQESPAAGDWKCDGSQAQSSDEDNAARVVSLKHFDVSDTSMATPDPKRISRRWGIRSEPPTAALDPKRVDLQSEGEEVEVLPGHIVDADAFLGAKLLRVVCGHDVRGEVEWIECGVKSRQRLYRIRYADGDLEHLTRRQVCEGQARWMASVLPKHLSSQAD